MIVLAIDIYIYSLSFCIKIGNVNIKFRNPLKICWRCSKVIENTSYVYRVHVRIELIDGTANGLSKGRFGLHEIMNNMHEKITPYCKAVNRNQPNNVT